MGVLVECIKPRFGLTDTSTEVTMEVTIIRVAKIAFIFKATLPSVRMMSGVSLVTPVGLP